MSQSAQIAEKDPWNLKNGTNHGLFEVTWHVSCESKKLLFSYRVLRASVVQVCFVVSKVPLDFSVMLPVPS